MTSKKHSTIPVYHRIEEPLHLRRFFLKAALDCVELLEKEKIFVQLQKDFHARLKKLHILRSEMTVLVEKLSQRGLDPLPSSYSKSFTSSSSHNFSLSSSRPSSELERLKEELSLLEDRLSSL